MIDYLISNSVWESDVVYKSRFYGKGECCLFGHPRNDIFFKPNSSDIVKQVKQKLQISSGVRICLYVPTYRDSGNWNCYDVDYDRLRIALGERFGGQWTIVVRFHPNMSREKCKKLLTASLCNATEYPDIQELLLAADAVITDYSSCIFDYMLTKRPGFIFATDLDEFNNDRGFFYPMESTPFPIAYNNDELERNILNFNLEEYLKKTEDFLQEKQCVENGSASKSVVNLIENIIG